MVKSAQCSSGPLCHWFPTNAMWPRTCYDSGLSSAQACRMETSVWSQHLNQHQLCTVWNCNLSLEMTFTVKDTQSKLLLFHQGVLLALPVIVLFIVVASYSVLTQAPFFTLNACFNSIPCCPLVSTFHRLQGGMGLRKLACERDCPLCFIVKCLL